MTSAATLYRDSLVWDNHGCMPFTGTERFIDQLERYRSSGVNVAMINIGDAQEPLEVLTRMSGHIRSFVKAHPDRFVMATSVEAIQQAKKSNRLAVGLDIEGAFAIGDQLSLVQLYYDLGVRWMAMVYNRQNLVGAGCHDEVDNGLTKFGRELISEMDRVGMIKCCSHTGYRTAMDVLTSTDTPTIFSHSNPRALREHPRNIPDELIDACAATGGVVCINGIGIFLGDNDASVARFADHVEYVVQRIGGEHVGIGLDYVFNVEEMDAMLAQGQHLWPPGFGYKPGIKLVAPESLPEVTEELLRRRMPEDAIRGVLGANLLRVAGEVWK